MDNVLNICKDARTASFSLAVASCSEKNRILLAIADCIEKNVTEILGANEHDILGASNLPLAMQDRLKLTKERIFLIAEGVREVANLDDPIGEVVESWTRPNGLEISKVKAPLGVIAVIYEARPNVTIDVAALCIKSGNCVVLRGGKEAINSNRALYNIVKKAILSVGADSNMVGFIDDTSREGTSELLKQNAYVDVVIPRGGEGLKNFVLDNATMPVIASAGGNCHLYIEKSADLDMSVEVAYNAKMSRPSTCNALEQIIVDSSIAAEFLPKLVAKFDKKCVLNGCIAAHDICEQIAIAEDDEYKKEHLDYILTVYIVKDYLEAIDRINANNTKHSDAIMSTNSDIVDYFTRKVDSGCVYVNASTRFSDGFEFGFGAEICISTQKLHARGPLGLRQLTSEKYIIKGSGQVRI